MSAEEHFSGFKKDIKSKFVSEDAIRGTTFEEEVAVEKVDNRPLYQRLAEKRQKQEDGNFCIDQEINEIYRLANRIRKLDEDEILFYEQIDSEQKEKEDLVKQIEREGLEKFRASAENIAKKVSYNAPSSVVKKPFSAKDKQKELLSNAVSIKTKSKIIKKTETATKPKNTVLVSQYSSDDD